MSNAFCSDALTFYPIDGIIKGLPPNQIGLLMAISGILNIFMSLFTVIWIKRNEYEAQLDNGREDAAKSVIFPVFVVVLWLNVLANSYAGVIVALVPINPIGINDFKFSWLYASMYALQHTIIEGVAFLLMQKGCGYHAGKAAGKWALCWGIFTLFLMFYIFHTYGDLSDGLEIIWDAIMLAFYTALWLAPHDRLFRRPAVIPYSKFWVMYRSIAIIIQILFFFTETDEVGSCGYIILQIVFFALFQPLVCYWTLLQDSRWWQGLEIDNSSRMASYENIRSPLLGSDFSLASAQSLAATMDRIRVSGRVKMLNFACIKIDFRRTLGSGSFSKVYKGSYRGKECAIKLIYTVDLTTDVIRRVAAEASILSSIRHPNIVHIFGVSVLPPSVCLILEVCDFGSLSDIIRGYGFDWSLSQRAPLHLSQADILYLALGCARGLAAVHAYDPNLCHRDVKSFNFLVDSQFTVKIADLELGIRDLESSSNNNQARKQSKKSTTSGASALQSIVAAHDDNDEDDDSEYNNKAKAPDEDQVQVDQMLANWMAPEVIREKYFQQASDVYALGTVLWEIVARQLPFEDETQPAIRAKILSGYQHPIPEDIQVTPMAFIIERCWCGDPSQRPTAMEVAVYLENILHDQYMRPLGEIEHTMVDFSTLGDYYEACYRKSTASDVSSQLRISLPGSFNDRSSRLWDRIWGNTNTGGQHGHGNVKGGYDVDLDHGDNSNAMLSLPAYSVRGSDIISNQQPKKQHKQQEKKRKASTHSQRSRLSSGLYRSSDDSDGEELYDEDEVEEYMSALAGPPSIPMPSAAMEAIRLVRQEPFWQRLEASKEAWVVVTPQSPYIVLHSTQVWRDLFMGIMPSSSHSSELQAPMMSLLALIAPELEAMPTHCQAVNTYVQIASQQNAFRKMRAASAREILKGLQNEQEYHGVLCLHLPNTRAVGGVGSAAALSISASSRSYSGHGLSNTSVSVDMSGRVRGINTMCSIHIYPVYAPAIQLRVDSLESDIASATATVTAAGSHSESKVAGPPPIAIPTGVTGVEQHTANSPNPMASSFGSSGGQGLMSRLRGAVSTPVNVNSPAKQQAAGGKLDEFMARSSLQQQRQSSHDNAERKSSHDNYTRASGRGSLAKKWTSSIHKQTQAQPKPLYYAIMFNELREMGGEFAASAAITSRHQSHAVDDLSLDDSTSCSSRHSRLDSDELSGLTGDSSMFATNVNAAQSNSRQSHQVAAGVLGGLVQSIGQYWSITGEEREKKKQTKGTNDQQRRKSYASAGL